MFIRCWCDGICDEFDDCNDFNNDLICDDDCTDENQNNICDEFEIYGCNDTLACNYNEDVTTFDNSCIYAEIGYDCDGNCFDDDSDNICNVDEIPGCIFEDACNYNPEATDYDFSCLYITDNYDCFEVKLMDGMYWWWAMKFLVCIDPTSCNLQVGSAIEVVLITKVVWCRNPGLLTWWLIRYFRCICKFSACNLGWVIRSYM